MIVMTITNRSSRKILILLKPWQSRVLWDVDEHIKTKSSLLVIKHREEK